jgi:hypothetical protein
MNEDICEVGKGTDNVVNPDSGFILISPVHSTFNIESTFPTKISHVIEEGNTTISSLSELLQCQSVDNSDYVSDYVRLISETVKQIENERVTYSDSETSTIIFMIKKILSKYELNSLGSLDDSVRILVEAFRVFARDRSASSLQALSAIARGKSYNPFRGTSHLIRYLTKYIM